MSKKRMTPWIGLAMSAALVSGCVAAPSVLKTTMPQVVGETYAANPNPPEFVKAIPVGEEVVVPRGKAAMTLFVVIPQKQVASEGERSAQYIEFSNIRRVDVTITGENLSNPVVTTINVSSGTSAAGTVVLNAGRNQVITAVGRDASGNIISTVKGVATSVAGQVVNAEAKFGTTPLAEIIGALSPSVAPLINPAAINGIINPLIGQPPYTTHPTFINPTPVVNAINALVTAGTSPSAITTGLITDQLGGAQPVYMAGAVRLNLLGVNGSPITTGASNPHYSYPVDRNNDGVLDGASYGGSNGDFATYRIYLTDPVTSERYWIYSFPVSVSNVPPGTFQLNYDNRLYGATSKPWEVFPWSAWSGIATVSVQPGQVTNLNFQLKDVSKTAPIETNGGTFSSIAPTFDTRNGNWSFESHEWHRFSSHANLVYSISYNVDQFILNNYSSGIYLRVFDATGTQLYQGEAASGSFTFASAATNSLYVYTAFASTSVNVSTQTLGSNQSLYNATIQYGQ